MSSNTHVYDESWGYIYYKDAKGISSDRLLTDGRYAFVYDNNGNLLKKGNKFSISSDTVTFTSTYGDGVEYWEYDYDCLNRLVTVRTYEGPSDTRQINYTYDPTGLRIMKTKDASRTYFAFRSESMIYSSDENDGVKHCYVWAFGKMIARVDDGSEGNSQTFYLHTDMLGSVMAITDQAGTLTSEGDYTPFGEKITKGLQSGDIGLYVGKEYDNDSGLYYFNARWYEPESGRFISEDPFRGDPQDPRTLVRYLYGANNPLRYVDPTGEKIVDVITVVIKWKDGTITTMTARADDKEQAKAVMNAYDNAASEGLSVAKFTSKVVDNGPIGNLATALANVFTDLFTKGVGKKPKDKSVVSTELVETDNWDPAELAKFKPKPGEDPRKAGLKFAEYLIGVAAREAGLTYSKVTSILTDAFFGSTVAGKVVLGILKMDSLARAIKRVHSAATEAEGDPRSDPNLRNYRYLATVLSLNKERFKYVIDIMHATEDGQVQDLYLKDMSFEQAATHIGLVVESWGGCREAWERELGNNFVNFFKTTAKTMYEVVSVAKSFKGLLAFLLAL